MKPSEKSPTIDAALTSIFGIKREESITANVCIFCGKPAMEFRDSLSEREYSISGMCQECQDLVFKEE